MKSSKKSWGIDFSHDCIFSHQKFTIMTDSQKATRVLNYLEEQDSTVIINLLNPFLDDYELALLYEDLKDEGIDL